MAGIGYGYAFPQIYIRDNTPATFTNLSANHHLFICLKVSFLVIFLLDLLLCWSLYRLFQQVNNRLAIIIALARLVYTLVLGRAIVHLFIIPSHMHEAIASTAVMYRFENFLTIWSFGLIIFGLHLVLLGCLLVTIPAVPKLISYMALFAGLCYLLTNMAARFLPGYTAYSATVDMALSLPMALGELLLAGWLLVKRERWNKLPGTRYISPDMA